MSGRMLQSLILQMKDATDRVIGVLDAGGAIVACSDLTQIGEKRENAITSLYESTEAVCVFQGYTYKPLSNWSVRFDYAVFVEGEDEAAHSLCLMASVALNNAKSFYDEKHDKTTFVKNIIVDNILPGDIYVRSNELHFPVDIPHIVFLIRQVEKNDIAAVDVLQSLFPDKQRDFVISISESDLVLVKEVRMNVDTKEFIKLAKTDIFVALIIFGAISRRHVHRPIIFLIRCICKRATCHLCLMLNINLLIKVWKSFSKTSLHGFILLKISIM